MIEEQEIQDQILKYLSDEQSFEELEDWLVERSRIQYLDNSESVRRILGDLRFLMFQFIEDEINESRFRRDLHSFIESREAQITLGAAAGPSRRFGSAAVTADWLQDPVYI